MKFFKHLMLFFFSLFLLITLPVFHQQVSADSDWTIVPGANNAPSSKIFSIPYATAAVSPGDAWLVGMYYPDNNSPYQPLIERWKDNQWQIIPGGDIGTDYGWLQSISAVSADDVWAVGQRVSSGDYVPLIEHWNGISWSVFTDAHAGYLTGVIALAANDVWAVGNYFPTGSSARQVLLEHWSGPATGWSDQYSVTLPTGVRDPQPLAISAASSSDIWAVGMAIYDQSAWFSTEPPLLLHWDGSNWQASILPQTGNASATLYGVSAVSGGDVWAVGALASWSCAGYAGCPLVMHYSDGTWTAEQIPSTTTYNGAAMTVGLLQSVKAISATDVWVAGLYFPNYPNGGS